MLAVTEQATGHLKRMLNRPEAPEGKYIRIHRKGPDFSLVYDNKAAGDQTYEHEGKTVLVVEEELAKTLSDKTIDLEKAEGGPRLVFA